jgi:manganese oxidase
MTPTPTTTSGDGRSAWTAFAALTAVVALVFAMVALARPGDDDSTAVSASAASGPVTVTLGDLFIEPKEIAVPAGPVVLNAVNEGAVQHTLGLKGTDKVTDPLNGGQSATLDLGELDAGTYTLFCSIPGHEDAGMKATLTVGGEGEGTTDVASDTDHSASGHDMTADEMDELMAERTKAFPAETEGKGGQPLEPSVLADGTKEFHLTTSEIDWEVEPGKTVKAMAYNGQVPGPTISVNSGDKLRFVVKNEMSESTAVHWHGIVVPNEMDGVPDITQPPIKPGDTFTYEFTAQGPAVGMYHSHHNAQVQVPNGLAGAFLIDQMPLPDGVTPNVEYTMMLNDAGTIGFSLNGKSFPATEPLAVKTGDWVLIHYLNEGIQAHPMHTHGFHGLVVAKDGKPVPQPYEADTVNVAPGERYSVLVHADIPGVWAWHCHILTHAETSEGMFGMVTAMVVQ